MLSSLGSGYADPSHQRNVFENIVPAIHENKPLKKKMTLVFEAINATSIAANYPTTSYTFNVTVPDGYIQGNSHLFVESFRMMSSPPPNATTNTPASGYYKIQCPDFNVAYSYDSATNDQTSTLVTVQGTTYDRSSENYIVLRDTMFLTSKNIRIQLTASDPTTYSYLAGWILILTIAEI